MTCTTCNRDTYELETTLDAAVVDEFCEGCDEDPFNCVCVPEWDE